MSKQTKAEKLNAAVGTNIDDSIGVRSGQPAKVERGPVAKDPRTEGTEKIKNAERIPVKRIVPDKNQPRKEFEAESIVRTGESLREHGQLQPILVRYDTTAKVFVIIDGERRWRAANEIGLEKLLCLIETADLTPADLLIRQTVANDLREDLNDVERANVLRFLIDELGLEAQQAADRLKMSKSRASRCLSLLKLDPQVQELVKSGDLPSSTANKLTVLEDPADQVETAKRIVDEGLSRESAEREIAVLADQREEEKAQDEANAPAEEEEAGDEDAPATTGEAIVKIGVEKKAKAEKKKAKGKEKKPAKVQMAWQTIDKDRGIKITAERKKGIELPALLLSLEHAAQEVRNKIKEQHAGKGVADLLKV